MRTRLLFPLLLLSWLLFLFSLLFLRVNPSESVPYTLFFSNRASSPKLGDYVSIRHPSGKNLVKRVAGVGGDSIEVKEGRLFLRGRDHGEVKERSLSGRPFSPVSQKEVPEGLLFLLGEHPYSYDSRYEEFGLVPILEVNEVLWPLF